MCGMNCGSTSKCLHWRYKNGKQHISRRLALSAIVTVSWLFVFNFTAMYSRLCVICLRSATEFYNYYLLLTCVLRALMEKSVYGMDFSFAGLYLEMFTVVLALCCSSRTIYLLQLSLLDLVKFCE